MINSHDTETHRVIFPRTIKGTDQYSLLTTDTVLETGANDHFFRDKPTTDYIPHTGTVATADGGEASIVGGGSMNIEKLKLERVLYVPTFTRKLVSGARLLDDGLTLVAHGRQVRLSKKGAPISKAMVDPKDHLMKFATPRSHNRFDILEHNHLSSQSVHQNTTTHDQSKEQTVRRQRLDINVAHARWGHCGEGMLRRTANSNSIELFGILEMCETCILTKSNQLSKKKSSNLPVTDLLDVVQIDLQGPFPLVAIDGTNTNMKLIDGFSGYIKMETIRDKTSATTADVLKRYIERMQLKTGKHFNTIAVDQGTEFDCEFLDLIKTMGLTKLKATAYKHHLPPKAERANQTLMKFGRTLLLVSRLPAEFYSEAQLMACYILNRLVHAGQTISPYEIMYGIRPQISHLHPFGTVCYVFVPQERRTKLAHVQEKGRLIGFGDDDSSEEIKGYKVVTELDSKIVWSSDVIFDVTHAFQPLTGAPLVELDSLVGEYIPPPRHEAYRNDSSDECSDDAPIGAENSTNSETVPITNEPTQGRILRARPTVRAPYEDSSTEDSSDEGSSYSASLSTLAIHHHILS